MSEHRSGMGAIVHDQGTAFRVWAPNASAVSVVGDFNDWDAAKHPMREEGNGYWYADIERARPGEEYKYALEETTIGSLLKIDPYAQQVTNSVGNSVIYDHSAFDWGDDRQAGIPHHELVIYELHVGSFFAEDDDRPGDFESVEKRLNHLERLGVNAIQLMPVSEFAGDYSWGYNPAHVFAVEGVYGGPDQLKELVRRAHKHGMAVIIDVVYNHFGPSDLDLWQFDGWSENGKGGIYFYNDHRSSTPWGDTRPDYGREEVRNFIRDNAHMWLRDYHADGLRWDMTPYIRSVNGSGRDLLEGWDMMRWVNTGIREEFPDRILIAEDMHRDAEVTRTEGAAFHAQWDGAFVHPVRQAMKEFEDEYRSVPEIAEAVTTRYNDDAFQRVVYTESHDEVANGRSRMPSEIDEGSPTSWAAQKRSTQGAALTLISPGIPMLFQGQEFLQGEWFRDDVPLDWDQRREFHGIVHLYHDLIRLRRNLDGQTRGLTGHHAAAYHRNDDDKILVVHRWADGGPGDDTLVVLNLSHQQVDDYRIGVPFAGHWPLLLNGDATVYSDDFGAAEVGDLHAEESAYDGLDASALVTVPPYSVLVFGRA